jgi:hypothetical protein
MGKLTTSAAAMTLAFVGLAAQARDVTLDDFTARQNQDRAHTMLVGRILACTPGGNGWAKFSGGQAFVLCGGLGTMQSARVECMSGQVSGLNGTALPKPTANSRKAVSELCKLGHS